MLTASREAIAEALPKLLKTTDEAMLARFGKLIIDELIAARALSAHACVLFLDGKLDISKTLPKEISSRDQQLMLDALRAPPQSERSAVDQGWRRWHSVGDRKPVAGAAPGSADVGAYRAGCVDLQHDAHLLSECRCFAVATASGRIAQDLSVVMAGACYKPNHASGRHIRVVRYVLRRRQRDREQRLREQGAGGGFGDRRCTNRIAAARRPSLEALHGGDDTDQPPFVVEQRAAEEAGRQ